MVYKEHMGGHSLQALKQGIKSKLATSNILTLQSINVLLFISLICYDSLIEYVISHLNFVVRQTELCNIAFINMLFSKY